MDPGCRSIAGGLARASRLLACSSIFTVITPSKSDVVAGGAESDFPCVNIRMGTSRDGVKQTSMTRTPCALSHQDFP